MTHPEKLNQILYVLLDTHRKRLEKQTIDKRLTFAFICNKVADITDDWEIEFLKQRLLSDGYIKMGDFDDGEQPEITQSGIKFIQLGAYERERENQDIERKIKNSLTNRPEGGIAVALIKQKRSTIAPVGLYLK